MPDEELPQDFDLSTFYYFENMVWVAPIALPIPKWLNIFAIFNYHVWLVCFGYFLLTALFLCLISRFTKKEIKRYKKWGIGLLVSFGLLLWSAAPKQPGTMMVRAAFISLAFYSLVLGAVYQSALITFLTNPVYEHQLSNIDEILESEASDSGIISKCEMIVVSDQHI